MKSKSVAQTALEWGPSRETSDRRRHFASHDDVTEREASPNCDGLLPGASLSAAGSQTIRALILDWADRVKKDEKTFQLRDRSLAKLETKRSFQSLFFFSLREKHTEQISPSLTLDSSRRFLLFPSLPLSLPLSFFLSLSLKTKRAHTSKKICARACLMFPS